MKIPTPMEAREQALEIIKSAGGEWVNRTELSAKIRLNELDLAKAITALMVADKKAGNIRIEKLTKRLSAKSKFGNARAVNDIKYRYIGE